MIKNISAQKKKKKKQKTKLTWFRFVEWGKITWESFKSAVRLKKNNKNKKVPGATGRPAA